MNDRNNDKVGGLLLEHMADALDENDEGLRDASVAMRFLIARDCAHQLRLVELEDWFTTGPQAALSMICRYVGRDGVEENEKTFSKLSGLVQLARGIPVGISPEADIPECRDFMLSLTAFSANLGINHSER